MKREKFPVHLAAAIIILLFVLVKALQAKTFFLLEPVPQDPLYHDFADTRIFFDIPNFMDVVSNFPFLLAGLVGIRYLVRVIRGTEPGNFITKSDIHPYLVFFAGVTLTSLGSAYYHISPDNFGLFWDRFPMTVGFMSFLSAVISENTRREWWRKLLVPLVLTGIASVIVWYGGETSGKGDLRMYIAVQYFPVLLIPLIVIFSRSAYTRSFDFIGVILIYGGAKVLEMLDKQIFAIGEVVSGHTLKHVVAALGVCYLLRMLKLRKAAS